MRGKKLILATTESGCIIPTSHKLNADGYFRKRTNGVLEMYHRTVWKEQHGDIPEGYEVDHKCRNRACCNAEHLQLLEGSEHTVKTNGNATLTVKSPRRNTGWRLDVQEHT